VECILTWVQSSTCLEFNLFRVQPSGCLCRRQQAKELLAKLGVGETGSALCGETAKHRVCSACLLVCFYNLRKLLGKALVFVRTATTQARWGVNNLVLKGSISVN
jgi:hypothetical protein